jgi:hypothetical protein
VRSVSADKSLSWLFVRICASTDKILRPVAIQHVTATPRPPSEVARSHIPPDLKAPILKCLAKRPADRFESAAQLVEALAAVPRAADWAARCQRTRRSA